VAAADRTQQILPGGQSAAPFTYTIPASTAFQLMGVRALFDGAGAATSWLPVVQLVSDAGVIMEEAIAGSVIAGGAANASFFPWRRGAVTNPVGLTYYQVIAALASTNSLVGEWHLTDGASPYADSSGSVVGGNGELILQNLDGTYTANNPDGPLTSPAGGPSVKFNVGGTNPPATSDYLHTSLAPLGRFTFAGNAVYTVVAWVKPVSSTNTLFGGVVSDVVAANFGTPAEIDDGWCIVVKPSTLECQVQRYCSVPVGGSPDLVSLGAMSTTSWTMVAMTYDGATLRGYADGALVGSAGSAGAIGGAQDVLVGLTQGGDTGISSWYRGAVSEVTVWASTLSDTEIAALYLAGVS